MSGAVNAVTRIVGGAMDAVDGAVYFSTGGMVESGLGSAVRDMRGEKEGAAVVETQTGLTDTERANLAATEAKRKQAKAKSGTKTVLTSPLGATTSAQTAVTKLGGA